MATTIAAPAPVAPAAPSAPAPSPAPAAAAPAPVAAPAAPQPTFGSGGVTTHVDPNRYPIREDFAAKVLEEKLAAIPAATEQPQEQPAEVAATPVEVPTDAPAVPAPDAVTEQPAPIAEEPEFDFDPPALMTPEVLTKMVTENPEFGQLIEADPRLKGQLYKTAREAAELQPYREIFPDLESAKSAVSAATEFNGVRDLFMGSTTPEGAEKALAKIAELAYERDEAGNPIMRDGRPVIGDDYHAFVDHVGKMQLESRIAPIKQRLAENKYEQDPAIVALWNTGIPENQARAQAMVEAAYARDQAILEWASGNQGSEAPQEALPDSLRRKAEELNQRERALNARQHGESVAVRRDFERGLQAEAQTRIQTGVEKIIANVEKQGGVMSPYLKSILPQTIGAKLIARIQANPALQGQMQNLQRLPANDASRTRRLAAIDRAVQQYLPEVARAELREAGVQIANAAAAKRAKVEGQIDATKKTEIAGSRSASVGGAPMTSDKAYEMAEAEWRKANPGRPFGRGERDSLIPRIVQLMGVGR